MAKTAGSLQTKAYIILIFLILPLGLFYMFSNDKREYDQKIDTKTEYLSYTLDMVESGFSATYQLIETTSVLAGTLPPDKNIYEDFLNNMFKSSRSDFVYGIGVWFEPGKYHPDIQWFGPYIRFNNPWGGPFSISYEWNSPEYNYHETDWYRSILNSKDDRIYITSPYFDTNYTYISFGKPFYRNGKKIGVVTVDIIVPILDYFFKQFDFSGYEGVFLVKEDNSIFYTRTNTAKSQDRTILLTGEDTDYFKRGNILELYKQAGVDPILLETETMDQRFAFYGIVDRRKILRDIIKNHYRNYIVFFVFWILLPVLYYLNFRMKKKNLENRQLNFENTSLKKEIEKRKEAEAALQFTAYHDPVTGMHNLNAFYESTETPFGSDDSRYLIQVSLENIRELSIIMERNIIDNILQEFAHRLISNCPEEARQFRGRGFNFYIICKDRPRGNAFHLSKQLLQEFRKAILLHNRNIRLRVRFGLAAFSEADDLNQVINMSQATLSDNNNKQIDQIFLYNDRIQDNNSRMISLDAAMSQSSFIDELHLLYQPIIRVEDRQIVGAEALLRWNSTYTGSIVSPADFIPLAEENGYIIELGWFVLQETIRVLSSGKIPENWFISVNVSPLQFIESGFPDKLDSMIHSAGIDKKRIKLEITESSAASTAQYFWQSVEELINREYRLAIDDFGTGESSFHRLYTLAFDTLKVDRTFVKDIQVKPRNIEIFRSLLKLGKSMENMVIVEGVETEKEHDLLKSLGMTFAQGYLYSRPTELTNLIKGKAPY